MKHVDVFQGVATSAGQGKYHHVTKTGNLQNTEEVYSTKERLA
jgi:hypothetical protein